MKSPILLKVVFRSSLVLYLAAYSLAQAAPAVVPISKEAHHHLVLENAYVRVYSVEVPPHSETLIHQHDLDYVFVTLGDSDVENVRVGEKPVQLKLKDGEVRFTKGGFAHKAVNNSDRPFRNVTVELKRDTGEVFCPKKGNEICAGAGFGFGGSGGGGGSGGRSNVLESPHWLISKRYLEGSAEYKLNRAGLVIFSNPSVLMREDRTNVACKAGEIRWIASGSTLKTEGGGRSDFVVMEYDEKGMEREPKKT